MKSDETDDGDDDDDDDDEDDNSFNSSTTKQGTFVLSLFWIDDIEFVAEIRKSKLITL